jgi:hypothetical protein
MYPLPTTDNYIVNLSPEGRPWTWQVTIHYIGRDFKSPEFKSHDEMRQWESDWYDRNRAERYS